MDSPGEANDIQEFTTPYPRRYRWLKRSIAIFIANFILLAITRIWFGRVADRRLQAEIDAIHARGEPILVSDYQPKIIPNSENAVWYYRQAMNTIASSPQAGSEPDHDWNDTWTNSDVRSYASYINGAPGALLFAHQARQHTAVDWGVTPTSPFINFLMPDLNSARSLATYLRSIVQYDHYRKNDREAIETLRDLCHLGDAVEQFSPPTLITHLVAIGVSAQESTDALCISRDLQIAAPKSPLSASVATRQQVVGLIVDLSDDHFYQLGGNHCWYGERTMFVDPLRMFTGLQSTVAMPVIKLDIVHATQSVELMEQAIGQPTWPAAKALMPAIEHNRKFKLTEIVHLYSNIMLPSLDAAVMQHFRALTERRIAVIALAIRLYRADYSNQWPPSLDALVPAYLPAIPVDPFSSAAAPLRYTLTVSGGPILYSVGTNGIDDNGSDQYVGPKMQSSNPDPWEKLDVVFHLTAPPPTTRLDSSS